MPVWLIIVLPILSFAWMVSIDYRRAKLESEEKKEHQR